MNGKAFGQVNFIAWEQTGGQFLVFDVYVRANLSLIDSQIRALFPKDDIRLSQANGSVVISGSVANATQLRPGSECGRSRRLQDREHADVAYVKRDCRFNSQVRVAEVNATNARLSAHRLLSGCRRCNGGYVNSGSGPSGLTIAVDQPSVCATGCVIAVVH